MSILSGRALNLPYSLSRWTDVLGSPPKFEWLKAQLKQGWMEALDPRGIPGVWSMRPQDTLGLILWTKNPRTLLDNFDLFAPYSLKCHITVTGWTEVEHGAPGIQLGSDLLCQAARQLGSANVTWRFSPVPMVPDVEERFRFIADRASKAGVREVFVSFLQPNDRMTETRTAEERVRLLQSLGEIAHIRGLTVRLCQDDLVLAPKLSESLGLTLGVCVPPEDYQISGHPKPSTDTCGCVQAVDPFSIREACAYSCEYCYTRDSRPKRSTTRLPIVR